MRGVHSHLRPSRQGKNSYEFKVNRMLTFCEVLWAKVENYQEIAERKIDLVLTVNAKFSEFLIT